MITRNNKICKCFYLIRIVCCSLFLLQLSFSLWAQDINFKHLSVEDGLSQVSVMSILSDDLGQMWFATRHGLNVYNGNNIRQLLMDVEGGKQGFERARQLCTDSKQSIYFLSDEELVAYDKQRNTFKSLGKNVMAICCRDSVLWAVKGREIFRYDNKVQKLEAYAVLEDTPAEVITHGICQDSKGRLWIGTEQNLYVVDKSRLTHLLLPKVNVKHLYEDKEGCLWISTEGDGLFKFSDFQLARHYCTSTSGLHSNNVRCVTQDLYGNFWIGTNKGVNRLDSSETTFTEYLPLSRDDRTLSHHSVMSVYCDTQGTVWIGTFSGGVNYFNPHDRIFSFMDAKEVSDRPFSVTQMATAGSTDVLLASSLGLFRCHVPSATLSSVQAVGNPYFTTFAPDIASGKVYCGTSSSGVYVYDIATEQMTDERISMGNSCLPSNAILALALSDGQLYIATNKGFVAYDTGNRSSHSFLTDLVISTSTPSVLTVDSRRRLWVGFLSAQMLEYDLKTGKYVFHNELLPQKDLEQATRVYRILEDSRRRLWAITSGKGIYRYDEELHQFTLFADAAFESSLSHCFDMIEMPDGQFAILTNSGISFWNADHRSLTHLYRERFAAGSILNEGCRLWVDRNFNLLVGTLNGLVRFNYHDVSRMPFSSRLMFSRLFIDSEEVFPQDGRQVIGRMLPYVSEINIPSGYRSFDIEVSNLDYLKQGNEQVEYRLEGFDKKWNTAVQNRIHYTNISPGSYRLEVRSPRIDGGEYDVISMQVKIHPPFYASVWAFMGYAVFLSLSAFWGFRMWDARRKLRLKLEYEQREKLRIENLNTERIKFYINLSHELLTPISLIMAQIESLVIDCHDLATPLKNRIGRIYKNADRLHVLIKEILNFRKNEHQHEGLKKISQYNIIPILEDILDSFRDKARIQRVKLDWAAELQEICLFVDKDEFQKVVSNLLSNAFKFTPSGGCVTLSCRKRQHSVLVEVSDTGVGIAPEAIERIFDRFYQGSTEHEGTGIGLSYVKEVMSQYDGKVSVRNNETAGCTFTLEFKEGYGHIHQLDQSVTEVEAETLPLLPDETELQPMSDNGENEDCSSILIVEDNEEMLALLVSAFHSLYKVRQARSAEEALTVLHSFTPDLILSDVMMEGMSGIELCAMVKRNYDMCHIPFVLLTALDMEENYVAGLQNGADDYITKPFKIQQLIMRCNSLINNRRLLQSKYSHKPDSAPQVIATNEADNQFVHKAREVVERNIDNMNFGTDEFAQEMAMSRAKLYSKIKAVTGMTVKEFVLNIKLKKAAELLIGEDDLLVTDIAYKLGFNSVRVFSQSFKDLFGETPAAYKKNHKS